MNKLQVGLDEVGRIHLSRAGYGNGIYTLETTEALRAFFQAERDQELGRWRDPENPDYVAYPGSINLNWVVVLDESTGRTDVVFKQPRKPPKDSAFTLVAERYFAAHPQPEPWHAARPDCDEVWVLTIHGCEQPVYVTEFGGEPAFQVPGGETMSLSHGAITAGRRIWPEGEASE